MSRCFPFPPPGYEKKPTPGDSGLLKEEKHKEKKHKKDKKDKEKREDKEKKEKNRSDGKHREKKDKKDKHKDKKEKHRSRKDKEKDKSKDKERSSISEEARLSGHPGVLSADTGKKDEQNSGIHSENKMSDAHYQVQHGQKPTQTSIPDAEVEESKFVEELGRRIKDDEKSKVNQSAKGFSSEWKRDETMCGINDFGNLGEDEEKNKEKRVSNSVMGAPATWNGSVYSGNAMVPNLSVANKHKVEGRPKPLEENNDRKDEKEKPNGGDEKLDYKKEKEKTKGGYVKPGHKNKDNSLDKKHRKKDKDREKEKEKVKEKNTLKNIEQDRFGNISQNDSGVVTSSKSPHISRDKKNYIVHEGNIKKRKEVEINGFLHESEIRPAKLPKPTPHEVTENGSKVEPLQIPHLFTSSRQGDRGSSESSDLKVVNTEHRINGAIQSQLLSGSRPKPSPMISGGQISEASRNPPFPNEITKPSRKPPFPDEIAKASKKLPHPHPNQIDKTSNKPPQPNHIAESSKKPPHPDLKHLSQILCVPKMEVWNEFDDQEWLFESKNSSGTKPMDVPNEEQWVWSEAQYISSADIVALPYVIPY